MLNKSGQRELAYIAKIAWIKPIAGADNIELVGVLGWQCIAKKTEFQVGDLCVYFEIDSKVDETNPAFEFLASKHYKVKTMKLGKFGVISQGLAMPLSALGMDPANYKEGDFVTKELNVTYSVAEDNFRKSNGEDKYKKMASRHPKLFQNPIIKKIYKTTWGKKLLFVFFGKAVKRTTWPQWVQKTDEERVENLPFVFQDKSSWIATEKLDGTSTTFTIKRGYWGKKNEFYTCSRNVVFDKPDKKCYYDQTAGNVYLEMGVKYNMEEILSKLLEAYPDAEWVTVQGETYGNRVQKRDYGMKDHDFAAFNLVIDGVGRINTLQMEKVLTKFGVPCVPILNDNYVLPDTLEELRAYVDSEKSKIDGGMREGIVFRNVDQTRSGITSFKCVSPSFLLKYHQ